MRATILSLFASLVAVFASSVVLAGDGTEPLGIDDEGMVRWKSPHDVGGY